jgi:hypothetical protein
MNVTDQELSITLDRIARFQYQVVALRRTEFNPANYHSAASGFLAEIDRMRLEVREYLKQHPAEFAKTELD